MFSNPLIWSVILITLGLGVIALELFLPSAGMLGVLAAALVIAGLVCGFYSGFGAGAFILLCTVLAIPILLAFMVKVWPNTPIGKRVLLDDLTPEDILPESQYSDDLIGQLGIAKTKMLPSGIVLVNDQKLDAVSDGFAIEPGQPIQIVAVKGNHIHVEPYEGDIDDVKNLPARNRDVLSQSLEELGLDELE